MAAESVPVRDVSETAHGGRGTSGAATLGDDAVFVMSRMATAVREWRAAQQDPGALVPVGVLQPHLHRGVLRTPLASSQGHWWRVRELGPVETTFIQEAMGYFLWTPQCGAALAPYLTETQQRAAWGQSVHEDVTAWAWDRGFPPEAMARTTPMGRVPREPQDSLPPLRRKLDLIGSGAGLWALPYKQLYETATIEYICEPHRIMQEACVALLQANESAGATGSRLGYFSAPRYGDRLDRKPSPRCCLVWSRGCCPRARLPDHRSAL